MAANADRRLQLLVLASLASVLAAPALATALVLEPPRLWWIGFAALSLTVFALGAAATLAVPRLRVSPLVPAMVDDQAHRLLVVADAICSPPALVDAMPVRVSHLHFLTGNESWERRQAEGSLALTLGLLHERGLTATGAVGDDKPLESMTGALGTFAATHVLLAIPPEQELCWLERELLPKARELATVEVRQVVIPAARSAASGAAYV